MLQPAGPPSRLQSRADAGISALVEEANQGDPVWWRRNIWIWGLPAWSQSGRPFRGLAALVLWRASTEWTVPGAWQEASDPEDPAVVVVPVRSKRGWEPLALVPGPRLAPLPFPVPRWDEARLERALAALGLQECPSLAEMTSKVHELTAAFLQSLRRHAAPMPVRHRDWTSRSLSVAARLAAMAAEAVYAAHMGTVFSGDVVWQRGDVAALFPWEAQEPGSAREAADRVLKRDGARVLASGPRPGQLPMRPDAALRLDRVWERGRVLEGYGRILRAMDALGVEVTGDAVLDTRALGLELARKAARLEKLPPSALDGESLRTWHRLRSRVLRKSWAHRLHVLSFEDIIGDKRWDPDRIIPRVRAAQGTAEAWQASLGKVPLSAVGLVRLLDAMGPKRPHDLPRTDAVVAKAGVVSDRTYNRYAIFKSDGAARWLDVPSKELAAAQRRLVEALRPHAPFAGVATAFEPGRFPALQARIHEGAVAAVVVDIADFFGSIRPHHLRWAFHPRSKGGEEAETVPEVLLAGGTRAERESLLLLLFAGNGTTHWLPQGAPSSPWAANLAAHPMDRRLRAWARDWGRGNVRYSRYADDLALSLHGEADAPSIARFLAEAEQALRLAVRARGWSIREEKTRRWRRDHRRALILCGVEVPRDPGAPCRLPRAQHDRARAALHRLRCGNSPGKHHGMLAWAWGATGQPGWLAWSSTELCRFASALAGPILAESLSGGWGDSVDHEERAG
jgi:hypothetical protein